MGNIPGKSNAAREPVTATTLASSVYGRLRTDIIMTHYAPGRRLNIQDLCDRFSVGMSPVREALNRLSSDRLVVHSDQRGFRVAPLDIAFLDDLTRTRSWLNEIALRESMARGDQHWEEGIALAYHRMSRTPRLVIEDGKQVFNPAWDDTHRAFHASLIAACNSPLLVKMCDQLFDEAVRFQYFVRLVAVKKNRADEHRKLMDAVIDRQSDAALAMLGRHFNRTADLVRERMAAMPKGVAGR